MSAYGKPSLEQAQFNARKVARTVIRLKHTIEADNELNEVMPILERRLALMAMNGQVPALTMGDIERVVNGEIE
jgi:hypothetical protein